MEREATRTGGLAPETSAAAERQPALPALDLRFAAGAALLLGLIVLVFWDFLQRQVRVAIAEQADWGHTLVIPFIAAYFVYRNREKLFGAGTAGQPVFRTTWLAIVPIVLGVAFYILTSVGPQAFIHHNLQGAGLALTLFGLALLFTGYGGMRWLWFPLAYLVVFGQWISREFMHLVTFKMQDIAAVGSEKLFILLGMDVTRAGNILTLFYGGQEHPLNIAEACSGMRMLMAFLALGVAMAYTGLNRVWQRVLLVALAVPIAIFVNMLRVVTLGLLSIYDAEFAAGDFHTFVGLVWLVPAFLLFLGAMWVVKMIVVEDDDGPGESSVAAPPLAGREVNAAALAPAPSLFDGRARVAFAVACAALLASGLGFRAAVAQLNIHLTKHPVELREKFPTIPRTLASWQAVGPDARLDAAMIEALGTDEYLDRAYVRRDADESGDRRAAQVIHVHLAYYTGMIDAVPHIPDRCFLAGGLVRAGRPEVLHAKIDDAAWMDDPEGRMNRASGQTYRILRFEHRITGRPVTVRMPIGVDSPAIVGIRTTEFRVPARPDVRVYGGFFFIANGQITPHPLEVRRLAFDLTDKYAYYCKVQFTMEGGPDFDRAAFARQVGDLLDELLPEIMRCLPDWAEVEERQET